MSFIHDANLKRVVNLLLERCKTHPRIVEFLQFFFEPSDLIFLPEKTVWKIDTIHLLSSHKNTTFFNIYQYPKLIQEATQRATQKTLEDMQEGETFPPNVFLAKTHEQKMVLAKWSVLNCPKLVDTLRNHPDWTVINPEEKEWTLPRLITILQRAAKIVTSTGSINYAHEPFFNRNAKWYFLHGAQGPYETNASKYKIIRVATTFTDSNTKRVLDTIL